MCADMTHQASVSQFELINDLVAMLREVKVDVRFLALRGIFEWSKHRKNFSPCAAFKCSRRARGRAG